MSDSSPHGTKPQAQSETPPCLRMPQLSCQVCAEALRLSRVGRGALCGGPLRALFLADGVEWESAVCVAHWSFRGWSPSE